MGLVYIDVKLCFAIGKDCEPQTNEVNMYKLFSKIEHLVKNNAFLQTCIDRYSKYTVACDSCR